MAYPVLISVYTRLKHLQNCMESLRDNDLAMETDLYVVSDAPKYPHHKDAVECVREYVRAFEGFKSITLFAWEENKGSADSIRNARLSIFEKFDAQIFMEDDNIVSPLFLRFMNDSLDKYRDEKAVFGVCGFNFDVIQPQNYSFDAYFMDAISANGWGTWKEKYMLFLNSYTLPDFNGKDFRSFEKHFGKPANNLKRMAKMGVIWGDTRITHYLYTNQMVCLFPCLSLVQNTGWDGSGEHCGKNSAYSEQMVNRNTPINHYPDSVVIDSSWTKIIEKFFAYPLFGKYKTALFDFKVAMKNKLKKRKLF